MDFKSGDVKSPFFYIFYLNIMTYIKEILNNNEEIFYCILLKNMVNYFQLPIFNFKLFER